MRRFLLFAWHAFEARGGWRDFEESCATQAAAEKEAKRITKTGVAHTQVVDSKTGKVVHET